MRQSLPCKSVCGSIPEGCWVKDMAGSTIPGEIGRSMKRTRQRKDEKRPKSHVVKKKQCVRVIVSVYLLDFGRNRIACVRACVRVWGRVRMQRMTTFVHGA